MSNSKAESTAKKYGWVPIGRKVTEIETKLTDSQKLELGHWQSKAMIDVEAILESLADHNKEIKEDVRQRETGIRSAAYTLKRGTSIVNETLACFLDGNERVYLSDDGFEMKREPAQAGDQVRLVGEG